MPEQSPEIEGIREKVLSHTPVTRDEVIVLFRELDRASWALDRVYGETLRYHDHSGRRAPR